MPNYYENVISNTNGSGLSVDQYNQLSDFHNMLSNIKRISRQMAQDNADPSLIPEGMDPVIDSIDPIMKTPYVEGAGKNMTEPYDANVDKIVSFSNDLLEGDHMKKFLDAATNNEYGSQPLDSDGKQYFEMLGILKNTFGANIDIEAHRNKFNEWVAEKKAEAGKDLEEKGWDVPANEELEFNRSRIETIQEIKKRENDYVSDKQVADEPSFEASFAECVKGLNARHRGDIAGIFSGDSKEMRSLKEAIANYQEYKKNPSASKFEHVTEEDMLDAVKSKAEAYSEAKRRDPKTGELRAAGKWEPSSEMGRKRLNAAEHLVHVVQNKLFQLQDLRKEVEEPEIEENQLRDIYDEQMRKAGNYIMERGMKDHLKPLLAVSSLIDELGEGTYVQQEQIDERYAELEEAGYFKKVDALTVDETREYLKDSLEYYRKLQNDELKEMEAAEQAQPELDFDAKKADFAKTAAEAILRGFYEEERQSVLSDGTLSQEQKRQLLDKTPVEKYVADNRESYMNDPNFQNFMDSIQNKETLAQMQEKDDQALFDFYKGGTYLQQPEKKAGTQFDVIEKRKEVQTRLENNSDETGMYPDKNEAARDYAVIATALQVGALQKKGKLTGISEEDFNMMVDQLANSEPFKNMLKGKSNGELYRHATHERGQNLYADVSRARKQYEEQIQLQQSAQRNIAVQKDGMQRDSFAKRN